MAKQSQNKTPNKIAPKIVRRHKREHYFNVDNIQRMQLLFLLS